MRFYWQGSVNIKDQESLKEANLEILRHVMELGTTGADADTQKALTVAGKGFS